METLLSERHQEDALKRRKELKPDKLAMFFSPFFGFILLIPFTRFGRFLFFTSLEFSSSHFTWPLMHTSRRVSGKVEKSLKFSTNFHIFHLTTINYHVNLMNFFLLPSRFFSAFSTPCSSSGGDFEFLTVGKPLKSLSLHHHPERINIINCIRRCILV